jgi:hypothetical protein
MLHDHRPRFRCRFQQENLMSKQLLLSSGLALSCLGAASAGLAQELTERLSSPVKQQLSSANSPYDLELCVADAVTMRGGSKPTVVRNGERNVIVFGYENSATIAVSLNAAASGTAIEIRTRGDDMDDRLAKDIRLLCKLN